MTKELKDYLHLYPGCTVSTPYGECKLLYFKPHVDERQYNPVVVDRGDNVFAFKLDEVMLHLRPLSDMKVDEFHEIFEAGFADSFCKNKIANISDSLWILHKTIGEIGDFDTVPKLLAKGFDLFNLIPEGLAIDKTKKH